MLTVREIASMPGLGLAVAGGSDGLTREVRWLHVSELSDPTPWLEGGELLLTTGLGVGDMSSTQRAYVRRLAEHGLAGLLFGLGFGFGEVPAAIGEEANRLGFPVLSVPYDTPFIAITKAAFAHLANDQLQSVTSAPDAPERLDEREISRRIAAFGLDPTRTYAAVLAVPANGGSGESLRHAVAGELDARSLVYLSAARRDRASFLVEAAGDEETIAVATAVA